MLVKATPPWSLHWGVNTPSIKSLIRARLASLKIPPATLPKGTIDLLQAAIMRCLQRTLRRHITPPSIARATAACLGKGLKGRSPLTSSEAPVKAQSVAGSLSADGKGGVA